MPAILLSSKIFRAPLQNCETMPRLPLQPASFERIMEMLMEG